MSNENTNDEIIQKEQEIKDAEMEQEEVVSRDKYIDVSKDLHKFKDQARKLKQELADLKAQQEAERMEEMREKQEWEKVAEIERQEKENLRKELDSFQNKLSFSQQLKAVERFVGGFEDADAYKIIEEQIKAISMENGKPSTDEVEKLGNFIIQNKSYLLKNKSPRDLPNDAPNQPNLDPNDNIDISKMTEQQLKDYQRNLLNNR